MEYLIFDEIKEIIDLYGVHTKSLLNKKIIGPDSAIYTIKDDYGHKYVLYQTDYISELEFERKTIEQESGEKVDCFIKLITPNSSLAKNEDYIAENGTVWLYVLMRVKI